MTDLNRADLFELVFPGFFLIFVSLCMCTIMKLLCTTPPDNAVTESYWKKVQGKVEDDMPLQLNDGIFF